MYLEFTTKQLKEYNKLLSVLDSIENPDQHESYTHMVQNFWNLCDYRIYTLKKYTIKQCVKFNYKAIREYKKYKEATIEQANNLIVYSNEWLSRYEEWEKQQNNQENRLVINGFTKLLKKHRKRKYKNG